SDMRFFICQISKFYKAYLPPHLAFPHLCALALAPAGAVLEPDVPAMPAADYFTELHDAFAQWKPEMRTEILDGIDAIIPAEEGNIEALGFHRVTKAFAGNLRQTRHAHPLVTHA